MSIRAASCEDNSFALMRREFETASFACAAYPAGEIVNSHTHRKPLLSLVIAGKCSHSVGRRALTCIPRQLHFVPPGVTHGCVAHTATRWFLFELRSSIAQRLPRLSGESQAGALPQDRFGAFAARLIAEIERDDDITPLAFDCLIGEILIAMCRQEKRSTQHATPSVMRARELICDQFACTIRVADVAHAVGTHPSHLAREFRRAFRCTMSSYIRALRVEKATELLRLTQEPLVEISQQCGFWDQSHFSKCFKQVTGVSPMEYRNRVLLIQKKTQKATSDARSIQEE